MDALHALKTDQSLSSSQPGLRAGSQTPVSVIAQSTLSRKNEEETKVIVSQSIQTATPLITKTLQALDPKALTEENRELYVCSLLAFSKVTGLSFAKIYELINATDPQQAFQTYINEVGEEEIKKQDAERIETYNYYVSEYRKTEERFSQELISFLQDFEKDGRETMIRIIEREAENWGRQTPYSDGYYELHINNLLLDDRQVNQYKNLVRKKNFMIGVHKNYIHYTGLYAHSSVKDMLSPALRPVPTIELFQQLIALSNKLIENWKPITLDFAKMFLEQYGFDPLTFAPDLPVKIDEKTLLMPPNWLYELFRSEGSTFTVSVEFREYCSHGKDSSEGYTASILSKDKLTIEGAAKEREIARRNARFLFVLLLHQVMLIKDKLDQKDILSLHQKHLDDFLNKAKELSSNAAEYDVYINNFCNRFKRLDKDQQKKDLAYIMKVNGGYSQEELQNIRSLQAYYAITSPLLQI